MVELEDVFIDLFALGVDGDDARWLVAHVGVKDLLVVRGMVDGLLRAEERRVEGDDAAWHELLTRKERIKERLAEHRSELRRERGAGR